MIFGSVYVGGCCGLSERFVCCSECCVVSNECDEATPCIVQPIGAHGGEVLYLGVFS